MPLPYARTVARQQSAALRPIEVDQILAKIQPFDRSMLRPRPAFSTLGLGGKTTGYDHVRRGLLTPPVRISEATTAWPAYELAAISSVRVAGGCDADVRAMVARLIELRRAMATREPEREAEEVSA